MSFGAGDSTEPYVQLGRSGLFVYRVGLGTMPVSYTHLTLPTTIEV